MVTQQSTASNSTAVGQDAADVLVAGHTVSADDQPQGEAEGDDGVLEHDANWSVEQEASATAIVFAESDVHTDVDPDDAARGHKQQNVEPIKALDPIQLILVESPQNTGQFTPQSAIKSVCAIRNCLEIRNYKTESFGFW